MVPKPPGRPEEGLRRLEGMLSVHIDPPACLDGRVYSLFSEPFAIHVFYPEFLKCSIFFGRLHGWLAGLGNHVSNLLEAICQVSELIAAAFRREDQLSRPVDLIFVREGHLLPNRLCDPVGARQVEPDFGLGVHFVNVLAPRTTAPTVRNCQAIYRNVIVALLCVARDPPGGVRAPRFRVELVQAVSAPEFGARYLSVQGPVAAARGRRQQAGLGKIHR